MPLIKSSLAPVTLRPFSLRDIENQARAILLRAQQQAEQLIAAAQAEALTAAAVVDDQNDVALGADDLLAADTVLQAGALDATSVEISMDSQAADVIDHAQASLANDEAMAAEAGAP